MKLYLVRHGETAWNKLKKVQGHSDISLNAAIWEGPTVWRKRRQRGWGIFRLRPHIRVLCPGQRKQRN